MTSISAITARRWALVITPVMAGVLAIVATLTDPAPQAQGRELIEVYAGNLEPLQFKVLGYHFSYTLWLASALGLAAFVRTRGSWIANVAWVLAILGISTIPGFLFADFVDAAMGQIVGVDDAVRVGEVAQQQWAFSVMAVPGFAGLLLALPLAAVAAWRAGLLAWWATAAVAVGKAAFIGFRATLPGNVLLTMAFAIFAIALVRIDPAAWYSSPIPPAEASRRS